MSYLVGRFFPAYIYNLESSMIILRIRNEMILDAFLLLIHVFISETSVIFSAFLFECDLWKTRTLFGMERKEKKIIFFSFSFLHHKLNEVSDVFHPRLPFLHCLLRFFSVSFDLTTNNHHPYQPVSTTMSKYVTKARGREREKRKTKKPSDTRDQGNDNEATSGFFSFSPVDACFFVIVYLTKTDKHVHSSYLFVDNNYC